ncbi:MAG: YkgJ family cysteine cluster protein [Candidatus Binatia bacterium]
MAEETVELYPAFIDGAFQYVCAECTALCCRGHGFGGSLTREMQKLFALYPAIESMASRRVGDYVEFINSSNRCMFLDGDNRCRIEKEHGKAAKPSVCRLFPFNVFSRIGKSVAVAPHFLCPLRLQVPPLPGRVEGTHSRIKEAILESGILDPTYLEHGVPRPSLHPSEDADSVLAREAGFRDACSKALGRGSFLDVLKSASEDPGGLEAFLTRASRILGMNGISRSADRDEMDDILLALAAPYRLNLLSLPSEGMLRALGLGELMLRRVLPLSSDRLSPKGAFGILQNVGPALRLLAHGDEPLELRGSAKTKMTKVTPFGDAELTFAAFAALRELGGAAGTLSVLEKAIPPSLSVSDRSVLLLYLGTQVEQAAPKRRHRRGKRQRIGAITRRRGSATTTGATT